MIPIPHKELSSLLTQSQNILLTTHFSPDGDALGAILATQHFLQDMGKTVYSAVPNPFPKYFDFLPALSSIMVYENDADTIKKYSENCDLVFVLDYNNLSRIDRLKEAIQDDKQSVVLIDHHQSPDTFTLNISDVNASSTCELLYRVFTAINEKSITPEIANCLFTGLLTDTGNFRHSCTSWYSHQVASELMKAGADNNSIQEQLGSSAKLSRLRLMGYSLHEKLTLCANGKVAYISLDKEELNAFGYETGDTEGLVNYALSVQGVIMAALIKEGDGYIKMSMRCIGDFSVNDFARKYFNGGGHTRAAGGRFDGDIKACEQAFLKAVNHEEEHLQ